MRQSWMSLSPINIQLSDCGIIRLHHLGSVGFPFWTTPGGSAGKTIMSDLVGRSLLRSKHANPEYLAEEGVYLTGVLFTQRIFIELLSGQGSKRSA